MSRPNIEYYIDDVMGVVVAKIPNLEEDITKEVCMCIEKTFHSNFAGDRVFLLSFYDIVKNCVANHRDELVNIFGKAKCNFEEDKYDIEAGKYIATQRLVKKVSKYRRNIYEEITSRFEKLALVLYERALKNNNRAHAAASNIFNFFDTK